MYLKLVVNETNDKIGINEVGEGLFEIITGDDEKCNSIVLDREELNGLKQILELFLKRDKNEG